MKRESVPTVLIVISRLNKGGIARYIDTFDELMKDSEYKFVYAVGNVQEGEEEDEIASRLHIHRIKNLGRKASIRSDIKAYFELWDFIKKLKPDILYSHAFKAGLIARLVPCKAKSVHVYHGHHLTSPDFNRMKKYLWLNIERILAKRSKILVTTGKQVAFDLINSKVGDESMYEIVRTYVPDPLKFTKNVFLKQNNVKQDKRIKVLWMGRLVPVKQPQKIIELAKVLPECLFIVAGAGELSGLFTDSKYENIVYIGWQPSSLTLQLADIFISTSLNEGLPIGLIEATLAKVPVVATNVGSVSEIIVDGLNGYLFETVNNEFAKQIKKLALDSDTRKLMGKEGRLLALTRFGPEQFIRGQNTIFERAL